ncbi:protein NO VEIN domain-containing protein (plasmid) [Pseudarthrobacter sp. P1]|uniref:protein NO VEIN domain-containing protein n=1 Tax=Pseudarthrobacter sp. P1 TaxID=3418418 RepID=UPI003CFBBAE9
MLVVELRGPDHEIVTGIDTGRPKKALNGRPLSAGHPVHEALIWTPVEYAPGSRNSILYGPDPETAGAVEADLPEARDLPGAGGQGLQMDADIRRAIENAAHDRLMRHYRNAGWTVTDTRQNHPYDAAADRATERIYLEAKGTQSRGNSVIVTRNEVDHAGHHPGLCKMGVWSGMRLVDGAVDPEAGVFRILPFNPDDGQLRPATSIGRFPATPHDDGWSAPPDYRRVKAPLKRVSITWWHLPSTKWI